MIHQFSRLSGYKLKKCLKCNFRPSRVGSGYIQNYCPQCGYRYKEIYSADEIKELEREKDEKRK